MASRRAWSLCGEDGDGGSEALRFKYAAAECALTREQASYTICSELYATVTASTWSTVCQARACSRATRCNTNRQADVWDWYLLVRANFVITTSFMAKRDLLFAAGPFNNKTLGKQALIICDMPDDNSSGEDHDLWKNCLRLTRAAFVREPLVYWRIDSPDKLTQSWKE
eukprot:764115-Hanusia_phi.AAC.3